MLFIVLFVVLSSNHISNVSSLTCTTCEFNLLPSNKTANCEGTCEGDVCFIVINKYFNRTINAGCMFLRENDKLESEAVCQRTSYDNRCACNSGDRCNDQKVKLDMYKFTDRPILPDYQWLPQIQPPMPTIDPVDPIDIVTNSTEDITEQDISQLQSDVAKALAETASEGVTSNTTIGSNDSEEELTIQTTVGLNVRENVTNQNLKNTPEPIQVIGSRMMIEEGDITNDVKDENKNDSEKLQNGQGSVEMTNMPGLTTSSESFENNDNHVEVSQSSSQFFPHLVFVTILQFLFI